MQELLLGIDICDDYSQISYFDAQTLSAENLGLTEEESSCMVPTVICKEKGTDSWFIGEEAYRCAHTLKGTAGNLSFRDLHAAASRLTEALRAGDVAAARALMPPVRESHATVTATLHQLRRAAARG